jgi:hypothetical protein
MGVDVVPQGSVICASLTDTANSHPWWMICATRPRRLLRIQRTPAVRNAVGPSIWPSCGSSPLRRKELRASSKSAVDASFCKSPAAQRARRVQRQPLSRTSRSAPAKISRSIFRTNRVSGFCSNTIFDCNGPRSTLI